jgi:hypothetical protein
MNTYLYMYVFLGCIIIGKWLTNKYRGSSALVWIGLTCGSDMKKPLPVVPTSGGGGGDVWERMGQ